MPPTVFDLRGFNRTPNVLRLVATGVLAATAWVLAFGVGHVVLWVAAAAQTVLLLLVLGMTPDVVRARRLVIDQEGIRIDRPELRLAWTELAGVGLVHDDRKRQRRARRHRDRPSRILPPDIEPMTVSLELLPTGTDVVHRHPELARYLRPGQAWRVPLTTGPGEPLPFAAALRRHRPDLWRGEHPLG